jgi:two-component system heavy metal sensor histidine kinase CusS
MKMTFRTRVTLFSAVASGLVLLAFVIASTLLNFDNMLEEADHLLGENVAKIVESEGVAGLVEVPVYLSGELAEMRLIEWLDGRREVVYRDSEWPVAELPGKEKKVLRTQRMGSRLWRVISEKWNGQWIVLALDVEEIRTESWRMAGTFLRALPVGLLIVGLGAWWVAGRAVKPIRAIADIAEKMTPEKLRERSMIAEGDDEIGRLGRVLNGMIDRLDVAFRQATRFSADASHELRTPLTVMQGKLDRALQSATDEREQLNYVELVNQVQQLKSLTDSLLMFSRSDVDRLHIERESLDLSAMLEDMVEDVQAETEELAIVVTSDIAPNVRIDADARLLSLAIYNLFQNAVKYGSPAAGADRAVICCGLSEDGIVRVSNTGSEIPVEDSEKIFDRFYRGSGRRETGGFGVGLSLARIIVRAHGGELSLEAAENGWTTFVVHL